MRAFGGVAATAGCGATSGGDSAARAAKSGGACNQVPDVPFSGSIEQQVPAGVPEPKPGKLTIAYANGLDLAEPLHIEGIAAKLETERLGGTFITEDAKGQPDLQLSQIQRFIARNVDGILVSVIDPGALAPALKQARAAGIPVIGVEINLDSTDPGPGWEAQIWPGRDHLAYLQAKEAARLLPCGGSLTSMDFAVRIPVIKYVVKREQFWAEKFGLKLLGTASAPTDDIAGGAAAMTQLLGQHPGMHGAVIYTDSVAEGARAAVRSAGKDLPIVGGNGGNGGFAAVKAQRIDATVQLNYPEVGKLGGAGLPLAGSIVLNQSVRFASGLSPVPDGLKLCVSGNWSGSCSSRIGRGSPSTHRIGNGSPQ